MFLKSIKVQAVTFYRNPHVLKIGAWTLYVGNGASQNGFHLTVAKVIRIVFGFAILRHVLKPGSNSVWQSMIVGFPQLTIVIYRTRGQTGKLSLTIIKNKNKLKVNGSWW